MFRILLIASSLLVSLQLGGCNIAQCVINDHPEFSKNTVNEATLNQVFTDEITVSISNSITDFNYDYEWRIEGDLPEGVEVMADDDVLTFSGTPTVLGDFPFTLRVTAIPKVTVTGVDPSNGSGALCNSVEVREMNLTVVQGN